MPTFRPLLTDFSAGELSPKLAGRVDLPVYFKGAQEITNFRVQTLGGVTKRPGTEFVDQVYGTNGNLSRIIPWVIDSSINFIVELSATAVAGEGRLDIHGATSSELPLTTPYLATELMEVKYAQSYRELYMVHPNHAPLFLRYVSGSISAVVFEYDDSLDTMSSNLIEWTAPTKAADIPYELSDFWEKVGLWLVSRKSYIATGTFAGETVSYAERRDSSVILTLTTHAYASIVTIQSSTALSGFVGLTINELKGFYVSGTGIPAGAYIVSNTATTAVLSSAATANRTITLTRGNLLLDKSATYIHQGNISIDMRPFIGAGNYPGVVAFYGGRLWMGGSINDPSTFWGSKVNDLLNFCVFEEVKFEKEVATDSGLVLINGSEGTVGITKKVKGDSKGKIDWQSIGGTGGITQNSIDMMANDTDIEILAIIYGISDASITAGKYVSGLNISYGTKVLSNDGTLIYLTMPAIAAGSCYMQFSDWKDASVKEYETVEDVTQQVGAGSAVRIKLRTEEDETIRWIAGKENLMVGTSSSEWVIENAHNAIQSRAVMVSRYGSANIQARLVGSSLVYVSASSRHIRQLSNDLATPLTAQSDQMIAIGITQLDFQQAPDVCLYAVLSDGTMARCVFDQTLGVMAWDRTSLRTGDKILSVAVVPGSDKDYVYIVTERTINSVTKRYIELFKENDDLLVTTRWYLDLAVQKSNATAFTTVTGLTHLASQLCAYRCLLATGVWEEGTLTVSAGGVATITSSTYAIVGLAYSPKLRLQRIETSETEGLHKQIGSVFFRLRNSDSFKLSWGTKTFQSNIVTIPSADVIYTGPIAATTDNASGFDAELIVESSSPVPCGIQGIVPEISVGE
jgi:hypothetical protein